MGRLTLDCTIQKKIPWKLYLLKLSMKDYKTNLNPALSLAEIDTFAFNLQI